MNTMWQQANLSRLKSEWASLVIFSKREYIIWSSYRMNAWMWFLDVLFNTTIVFMLSLMTQGSTRRFCPYGSNYVTFVVLGFCVHYISWTNLGDPFNARGAHLLGRHDGPLSAQPPLLPDPLSWASCSAR